MLGVIVLVVLAGIGGVIVWIQSSPDAPETPEKEAPSRASWLPAWSTQDASEQVVTWSDSGGPAVEISGAEVRLAPRDLRWNTERRGDSTVLVGEDDDGMRVSWQFADGNPSALLRVQKTLPVDRLSEPVGIDLDLPQGGLEAWSAAGGFATVDAYRSDDATSPWVRWSNDDSSLTLRAWNGDALDAAAADDGGVRVRLSLWSPTEHPDIVECIGELEQQDVTLDARAIVEFRKLPKLATWPYPNGSAAMMLPVFVAPELHTDPQLGEAKSRNAADFVDRVTTLAYGHSSSEDPRYGNGGLLGHGLGGTVVAPPRLLKEEKVRALAEDMAPTGVDVAAGGSLPDGAPYDALYSNELNCASLRSRQILGTISPRQSETDPTTRAAPSPFATRVAPRMLDGRLDSLLAQGFSRAYAEQALRDRGVYAFASPMVATRNPLVGAAADAVLEPERKGMWTVSPRLAGSLADVELWRESQPIGVSSVSDLVRYWHFSDQMALVWSEDGAPSLLAADPGAQVGYTIAIDGVAKLPDALRPPPSVRIQDTESGSVTLMMWDAALDKSSLALERDLSDTAVDWTFKRK